MNKTLSQDEVESKILRINDHQVILDSDVASLYGVKTRDVNKAVKNNPDKFPEGYLMQLTQIEKRKLVENFHRLSALKHSTTLSKFKYSVKKKAK